LLSVHFSALDVLTPMFAISSERVCQQVKSIVSASSGFPGDITWLLNM